MFTNIFNYLNGKKTYFVGVIGATIALLEAFGVIALNTNQLLSVAFFIAALFAITFRDALNSLTVPASTTDTTNKTS